MAEPAVKTVDADEDTAAGPTIDRDHLARMTFGDSSLERELLTLFDRQSVLLLERIEKADATTRAALAHTLKGSALSIGAVGVARAAAALEQTGGGPAIDRLTVAVVAARTTIATLLCDS